MESPTIPPLDEKAGLRCPRWCRVASDRRTRVQRCYLGRSPISAGGSRLSNIASPALRAAAAPDAPPTAGAPTHADSSDADPAGATPSDDLDGEQQYVTMLYQRLDQRRADITRRLRDVLRNPTAGTPQARTERDVAAGMYSDQLATLNAVEQGLCFGRLDLEEGSEPDGADVEGMPRRYIGRLGLLDEDNDYEPLLIDWRAPVARSFYTATAASPDGVRRRRHLRTRSRTVLGFDDEVLDLDAADLESTRSGLTSEAALLAALGASRTGRMSDIVATIQVEQDRIIRAKPQGVMVVQGGPGTGKTAVALHRAAYLLYTHRQQLAKRGVLVVGPNPTFLRYIGQVLPSLGETSVLLCTVAELHPGLHACGAEPAATAGGVRGAALSAVAGRRPDAAMGPRGARRPRPPGRAGGPTGRSGATRGVGPAPHADRRALHRPKIHRVDLPAVGTL